MAQRKSVFLVGLMGAGKSTIGRHLARRLGMDFYDSDQLIVEKTGVPIATIFDIEGENGFRDRESQVISELCELENCIVATGGGSLVREENREAIRSGHVHVIYLCATAEKLYSRIKNDKARPLMQTENPLQTLRDLLASREAVYLETSDTVIRTGNQKVHVLLNRLEKIIRQENTHADPKS